VSEGRGRYQDYVIKDGRLIGAFEEMYRESAEVPWHQDKTAHSLFSEFDLAVLRQFNAEARWQRVLDLGCGLGHMTTRIAQDLPAARVEGIDISPTAIAKAAALHPHLAFRVEDVRQPGGIRSGPYDLIVAKELLWYVLPQLTTVVANLRGALAPGGWLYVSQAVPDLETFYGQSQFPNPAAVLDYFAGQFKQRYASICEERSTVRVVAAYNTDRYARFLGTVA
jgi:trans-aconitate methyltransferase